VLALLATSFPVGIAILVRGPEEVSSDSMDERAPSDAQGGERNPGTPERMGRSGSGGDDLW
jgi:hypothetical protein